MIERAKRASRGQMRSGPAEAGRLLDVTVVLLDRGYASTAIGPIEVFHSAGVLWNRLHGLPPEPRFKVRIASIDGGTVSSLCALGLKPECAIGDVEETDIVIVSASGLECIDSIAATGLLPWLRKWHARGAYIVGICSGVSFLAECGLLDGRQATTHWGVAESLRARYPKVKWRPEQFVTEDGGIFCSGGLYSAIDMSLHLVEKICGHEVALQCAKAMLVSMPRSRQSGYGFVPLSRPHADDRIRQIEDFLRENFDGEVPIRSLADRVGMSPRNFIRRFKAATGRLPGAYVQMLRIAAARELLETGSVPVNAVAADVGYDDVAFFRSLFRRHTGMTPAEYRSRFGRMGLERGELAGDRPKGL